MTFEQVQARMAELIKRGTPFCYFIPDPPVYEVVWAGGELLPERDSVDDDRMRYVPSYDIDEGAAHDARAPQKRLYNLTGNHRKVKPVTEVTE